MTEIILVTGATGTVGRALLKQLSGRPDVRARALSRNPRAAVPPGVELVVGDFLDEQSLDYAMVGVSRLFLLSSGAHIVDQDAAAIAAASRARIGHVVKLSALGVGHGSSDPITRWHRAGEDRLRDSVRAWTILRPTGFMTNTLEWAPSIQATGTVLAPFADGRTALIDPRDVAGVAAASLTEGGHEDCVYELTGPEALSPGDQVRILGEVLDRAVTYIAEAPDTTRSRLERYGMPAELAEAVVSLLATALEDWNAQPSGTIEEVTGLPPRDFRTWVQDHQAAFR